MFRTIVWYAYFWLYLLKTMPAYIKANRLLKQGKINERDAYVSARATKWGRKILGMAGARVTVVGAENVPVDRPVLFVSNHQSNLDIPILLGFINKPKGFIAKVELLKLPILSTWMKQLNCVFMDRNDMRQSLKTMNEATEIMKNGFSMVIFPEGTRSKSDNMGEFKPGSLRIASKAGVPIVPVTINGSYKLMEQNGYKIMPADVELVISEPIETTGLTKEELAGLHERVRSIIANNK